MKVQKLKIENLKPLEKNVRCHPPDQIKEIQRSVKAFGQYKPIVVDEESNILSGNGLYISMEKMGREKILAYVIKGLTQTQKNKLILADNRTYDLGISNNINVFELLQEIKEEENEEINVPGYDDNILEHLLVDESEVDELFDQYGSLEEDNKDRIGFKKKRLEGEMKQITEKGNYNKSKEHKIVLTNDDIKVVIGEDGEQKAFIKCPECGKKVWL